jgi:hypothetical protein
MSDRSVLVVGIVPELVDFSAFPGMNAEKVRAGIAAQVEALAQAGIHAESCFVDLGETAEAVLAEKVASKPWRVVVIGAGIRVPPPYFLLFEKLLNVVHAGAPGAKIAFNTSPGDTLEAARRWL